MAVSTLFVRNLPASASNSRLEEIFSEIGPLKHCFVVKEKGTEKCRGLGYVTFSMEEDSQRALREIKEFDGQKISVVVAKKKQNKRKGALKQQTPEEHKPKGLKKNRKKARLIIRNLSFKCSEEDLRQVFSGFGTVLEVNIPLKPDGKMRGFAFVQMKNVLQAGKALNATNLKEIKGRQVAVDWAVAKDKFVATQVSSSTGAMEEAKEEVEESEEESQEEEEEEGGEQSARPLGDVAAGLSVLFLRQQQRQEGSSSEAESSENASEEEEEEEEEEAESVEADSNHSNYGSDEDEEADEDGNSDDDDGDDDDEAEERPAKKKPLPSDVKEGKTVFIRNLSFDTEEHGLEEMLLQFGELKYIRIVLHPDTQHSKGCAFAQFKTKEAAEKCIAVAQEESEDGGLRVDGRRLSIVRAVSREDAVKLKEKKVKTHTGTRNLYLAREGSIRAGTKAAEGVSAADMTKRARFEEMKRVKLRDINVFVSKTRLCVHNLPKSVDTKQLRALSLKAAGTGKAVRVSECRVMYDRKPQGGKVMGRSLGYGFVQFQEHEHALNALRHLNNNPDIFGPLKRPIVEFSLEDGRKLKMKEIRAQQNRQRVQRSGSAGREEPQPAAGSGGGGSGAAAGGSQYSGFRTRPEVEEVELPDGKKRRKTLPLPSHRGPKIRKRDQGKAQPLQPKKREARLSRKERASGLSPPGKRAAKILKKGLRNKEDEHFDSLVEQYKKRVMGNPKKSIVKKSKWFSS
ncbi:RNA-binding protein 28 [Megalops cyprinoides]|uniref:RNA-binding protein 28 n=1 Tax=Megalops cyprinoides TaxID=118141 RepID=UPI00186569A2|nr:RNA-binding protein 28 [Megalops cyprinoides]